MTNIPEEGSAAISQADALIAQGFYNLYGVITGQLSINCPYFKNTLFDWHGTRRAQCGKLVSLASPGTF